MPEALPEEDDLDQEIGDIIDDYYPDGIPERAGAAHRSGQAKVVNLDHEILDVVVPEVTP